MLKARNEGDIYEINNIDGSGSRILGELYNTYKNRVKLIFDLT